MANQITPNPSVPSQVVAQLKFPRFVNNLGIIPTSYKDSMSYYETLAWLCKFLEETVIPTVNENGEAVEELQNLYVQLNSYVTNYFDNLDVQEEINNKLDDMVEQGTLQEIIATYLNSKAIFGFDTVAEMKNATNLIDGSYARTLGFYEKNDGGSALYKIREITNDDVVDNMFIIEMNDSENNLIAELIYDSILNIKQLGAKGNGIYDNTNIIQSALNNSFSVYIPNGTYLISSTLQMNDCKSLKGENAINTSIYSTDSTIDLLKLKTGDTYNIQISDLKFKHETLGTGNGIVFGNSGNWQMNIIENCRFENNNIAIYIANGSGSLYSSILKNIEIYKFTRSGIELRNVGSSGNIYSNIYIHNNENTATYGFFIGVEDNATLENINVEWGTYSYAFNLSQVRGLLSNIHIEGASITESIFYLYASDLVINNLDITIDSNFSIYNINNGYNNITNHIMRIRNSGNSNLTVNTIKYTSNVLNTDRLKIYQILKSASVTVNTNPVFFGCHLIPEVFDGGLFSEQIRRENWKLYLDADTTIKNANYKDSIEYIVPVTRNGNPVTSAICMGSGVSSDVLVTESAVATQYANSIAYPKSAGTIPANTAIKINDTLFYTTSASYNFDTDNYKININANVSFASGTYSLYKTGSYFVYN